MRYLSQIDVSPLLGYNSGQDFYARLERGLIASPSDNDLRRIATLLRLEEHQWNDLNTAINGYKAPKPVDPHSNHTFSPQWHWVIEGQDEAAYISDFGWNVVTYNAAAEALLGRMPRNIMRWMLSLTPEEHSRARMPDWAEHWGPVALSQLTAALNEEPGHAELRTIEREVLADPELNLMYATVLDSCIHPDGTRRLMTHGTRNEPGIMHAAACTPMGSPQVGVVFMKWTPLE
ncbi:helix-turn-helix domain-containing protein [Streptomyces kanamyceticus]|uniref:XRE family transcriptional regulator n=1 Tax=Streptomyces kanamyceticus TaxID=1967 RepID=A0A5J6GRX5_STRKN|nr:helix-turn-helix domain-containing protein [Streptomyces kanamyceticus]QEU96941.1 XRE family transcriptional regulator [Streptomyces kanamyceticus]